MICKVCMGNKGVCSCDELKAVVGDLLKIKQEVLDRLDEDRRNQGRDYFTLTVDLVKGRSKVNCFKVTSVHYNGKFVNVEPYMGSIVEHKYFQYPTSLFERLEQ